MSVFQLIYIFLFYFLKVEKEEEEEETNGEEAINKGKRKDNFFLFPFLVFHSLHEFLLLPPLFFPLIHFEAFVRFESHANGHYIFFCLLTCHLCSIITICTTHQRFFQGYVCHLKKIPSIKRGFSQFLSNGGFWFTQQEVGPWSISNVFFSRMFLVVGLSSILGDFSDF